MERKAVVKRIEHMHKKRGPEIMTVKRRTMRVRFPEPARAGDRAVMVTGLAKALLRKPRSFCRLST